MNCGSLITQLSKRIQIQRFKVSYYNYVLPVASIAGEDLWYVRYNDEYKIQEEYCVKLYYDNCIVLFN
jgi:hypothetical protein